MFSATLIPWFSAYMNMSNTAPYGLDYSALTLVASIFVYLIGIFRYRMLMTIPIARDEVFLSAKEGIIILDNNYCIIDFNHSASCMFEELGENCVLKKFHQLFPDWPEVEVTSTEYHYEFTREKDDGVYYYTSSKIPLIKNTASIGAIITTTDVTRHVEVQKRLEILATVDTLTGLYNRRFLYDSFSRELNRAMRYGCSLSVIMFDLDYFKKINAEICYHITASFGVSGIDCYVPGILVDSLVKNADQALYLSKESGRNRVTTVPN